MDPLDILVKMLGHRSPALLALLPASIAAARQGVKLLREYALPNLHGNAVQTLAAGVALAVIVFEAGASGLLTQFHAQDLVAYGIAAACTWLGAMGFHEAVTDQNDPPVASRAPAAAPSPETTAP